MKSKVVYVFKHILYWWRLLCIGIFNGISMWFRLFSLSPFIALAIPLAIYWMVMHRIDQPSSVRGLRNSISNIR